MRKLLCMMLVLALVAIPVVSLSVAAESAVDESIILSDLIPIDDSAFEPTDCEAKINNDGSLTITITGPNPALKIKLAEGNTLLTGRDIDLSKAAYVAVDCGVAGQIVVSKMVLNYTRKDKAAAGGVADLYLQSMYSDDYNKGDYAGYRTQVDSASYDSSNPWENGSSHYVVWNWGTYVASSDAKLFDDKMHHFTLIDLEFGSANTQKSTVGSQITFYTIAVVSDPDVKLGTVTPDPIEGPGDTSSDASDASGDESNASDASSDASDASGDESDASDASSSASSEASSTASSEASSTATSSTSSTSSASSTSSTSSASSTASTSSDGGNGGSGNTGLIVGIIAAVVVVIGAVVGVVVAKKKK